MGNTITGNTLTTYEKIIVKINKIKNRPFNHSYRPFIR